MNNPIQELYSDKAYCYKEIHECRRIFSDPKEFNPDVAERLEQGLALMYLYCPEDIQEVVEATLVETGMRKRLLFGGM